MSISHWLSDLRTDLHFAMRQLRGSIGVTTMIVLTLAVGIGASATMAGTIRRLLFSAPPGIGIARDVVRLLPTFPSASGGTNIGAGIDYPTLVDFSRQLLTCESVAGYSNFTVSAGSGPDAFEVTATMTSSNFFGLLKAQPALGRFFAESDNFPSGESAGGPALLVLSHGFWQRRFGGDVGVLGKSLRIGSVTYTVVAVASEGFRGVEAEAPDMWIPISVAAAADANVLWASGRGTAWISAIARMKVRASHDLVGREATQVYDQFNHGAFGPGITSTVLAAPLLLGSGPATSREAKVVLCLGGVSLLLLLITCSNVANLLLARALTRQREFAVRYALGAGRSRIVRQLLTEGLLIALLGGFAAALIAIVSRRILLQLLRFSSVNEGPSTAGLFLLAGAIALGACALISIGPLLQSGVPDISVAFRGGSATMSPRSARMRSILLATQGALCMLLLVVAGLFTHSLRSVENLDIGMDADRTIFATFDFSGLALPRPARTQVYREMYDKIRAIPGVARIAFAEKNPYRNGRAVGLATLEHEDSYFRRYWMEQAPMEASVDSGFFRTVGARIRGRDFTFDDRAGQQKVAIINEPLAKILWPEREAVGQCMIMDGRECTMVVGVVKGFWRRRLLDREQYLVYTPLAQNERRSIFGVFISVNADASLVVPSIRRIIQGMRPDMPAIELRWMKDVIEPEKRPWRIAAFLFLLFGSLSLFVAVIGLYGVVSFATAERAKEVAIRMALGAHKRHILVLVSGRALVAIAYGLMVGTAVALLAGRWLAPLLFSTSPTDPRIYLAVGGVLVLVSALAANIATWQVFRKNSAALLRAG